jgi:hypothetical protein
MPMEAGLSVAIQRTSSMPAWIAFLSAVVGAPFSRKSFLGTR